MFKNLLLLCLVAGAIQAVPTNTKENDVFTENIVVVLQRILDLLERLDLPVIGDIVDIGAPIYRIKEAIEAALESADNEESLSCLTEAVEEIGNDVAVKLVEDLENLLNLILERQEKIEACYELTIGAAACRTSVQIAYSMRIIQAANEITNGIDAIPAELREKVIDCLIGATISGRA